MNTRNVEDNASSANESVKPNSEIHALETQLINRFRHNMNLFKCNMSIIYEYFKAYRQESFTLVVDKNKRVNMSNKGRLIYSDDAKQESLQELDRFYRAPVRYNYSLDVEYDKTIVDHFIHIETLQALADVFTQVDEVPVTKIEVPVTKIKVPDSIESLIIIGVGLGYHIEKLFKEKEIKNVFLYEKEADIFYASLFAIDWEPILRQACRKDVNFKILIGNKPDEVLVALQDGFNESGYHVFATTYLYRHVSSRFYESDVKRIMDGFCQLFNGWGFIDDELISIAHTLVNAKACHHFFSTHAKVNAKTAEVPVVIVGNGPSLDKDIDVLREINERVIVICAGCSTLKALHRYGIKPDILTVIERTRGVVEWLHEVGDQDFLHEIKLITINNTHPEVIACFRQYGLALKEGDAGAELLLSCVEEANDASLTLATPTGVNAAVSFLISKGFKRCYLLGMDLGFREPSKHHSKESAYFSSQSGQDLHRFDSKRADLVTRDANFGGTIYTDMQFDASRRRLELLLMQFPEFECINTSDGAKINHTITIEAKAITIDSGRIDKASWLNELFTVSFPYCVVGDGDFEQVFEQCITQIRKVAAALIEMLNCVECLEQVSHCFKEQHDYILSFRGTGHQSELIYYLFSGTLHHCHVLITRLIRQLDNKSSKKRVWEESREIVKNCLVRAVEKISTQYKEVDTLARFDAVDTSRH